MLALRNRFTLAALFDAFFYQVARSSYSMEGGGVKSRKGREEETLDAKLINKLQQTPHSHHSLILR